MVRRLILPMLVMVAGYYAIFGGEYSVFEVRSFRIEADRAQQTLAELRDETDAYRTRVTSLEEDPAALEVLARENFGMIRDGEVLYRFADPVTDADSGG